MLCPVCLAVGKNETAVTTVGGTGFCGRHGIEAIFGAQNDGQPIRSGDSRMRFTVPSEPGDAGLLVPSSTPPVPATPPAPVVPTPMAPATEQPGETPT